MYPTKDQTRLRSDTLKRHFGKRHRLRIVTLILTIKPTTFFVIRFRGIQKKPHSNLVAVKMHEKFHFQAIKGSASVIQRYAYIRKRNLRAPEQERLREFCH